MLASPIFYIQSMESSSPTLFGDRGACDVFGCLCNTITFHLQQKAPWSYCWLWTRAMYSKQNWTEPKWSTHRLDEGGSKGVINVSNSLCHTFSAKHVEPVSPHFVTIRKRTIMQNQIQAEKQERLVQGRHLCKCSHLCPCSESCRHLGAPEPRRCLWRHHWEQQPWKDLESKHMIGGWIEEADVMGWKVEGEERGWRRM